jgi:hypothetical protein
VVCTVLGVITRYLSIINWVKFDFTIAGILIVLMRGGDVNPITEKWIGSKLNHTMELCIILYT